MKADICREYRTKYGMTMPTQQLARIVYKENPLVFKDVANAHQILRYIEGKNGNKDRKKVMNTEFFNPDPRNPRFFDLPKSEASEYVVYQVPEGRLGIISDIHCPYHSVEALTACINYFIQNPIDTLLINGDWFDFYGGSRFMKDPRKMDMAQEIEIGCEMLRILYDALNCKIVFKIGNHDARLEHYIWQKLPEISQLADLMEIKEIDLEKIVKKRCPGIDIEFVASMQIMDFCGLSIVHGHEFGQSVFSPVNIARGLFLRGGECVVGAHHHQTSEHTQPTMRGRMITTWSIGCLCSLMPEYLPINKWNHGFMRVEGGNNEFHVKNLRILGSKIL